MLSKTFLLLIIINIDLFIDFDITNNIRFIFDVIRIERTFKNRRYVL